MPDGDSGQPPSGLALRKAFETLVQVLGQNVSLASAEGLILTKLIGFRPQDQADIQDLFDAYGTSLDMKFVRDEFASVASVDDPRWGFLERCEREGAP